MRLFELDDTKSMATTIVAISDQLKSDLDRNKIDTKDYTLDKLLNYFHKYDVIIGKDDLFNMIKKDPLKGVISNIQGQKVVFKGHEEEKVSAKPEKEKETVSKMAHKAMKNK